MRLAAPQLDVSGLLQQEVQRVVAQSGPIFSRPGRDGPRGPQGVGSGLINLANEGAVGGNAAQDTASLQVAIAKAVAAGCGIEVPISGAGAYQINVDITIPVPLTFYPGAQLAPVAGHTLTIGAQVIAGPHQIFSGLGTVTVAAGAWNFSTPRWFGALPDGSDAAPAFQRCLDIGGYVLATSGRWTLASDLVLKKDYTRVQGVSQADTTLVRTAGNGIRNYAGLDTDTAYGAGAVAIGAYLADFTLEGGFTHTDVFAAPTNSWSLASGRDKVLTTAALNLGLRWKVMREAVVERVTFTKFHRPIFQAGSTSNTFRNCTLGESEVGFWTENGASWGDASYKNTTQRIEGNRFKNDWFGIYGQDLTDQTYGSRNIFEPCNTAIYFLNGGDVQSDGDYFELCYEGVVVNGGFASTFTLTDPHFTGVPGNFWGGGKSIYIMATVGSSAVVRLRSAQTFGGGGIQIDGGRLVVDQPLPGVAMNTRVEVRSVVNRPLYPDPQFTKGAFLIDAGAGISATTLFTDEIGEQAVRYTGTDAGLAFNGLRLFVLPGVHANPVKLKFQYRYTGTTVGFTPFGLNFSAPTNGFRGAVGISDTGGKWVTVDLLITDTSNFGTAAAQGGFNGTLELKNLYVSEGYGPAESYPKNTEWTADNSPSTRPAFGPWKVGDIVYNYSPAELGVAASKYVLVGWICTVAGTPGTWLQLRNLTGN